MTFKNLFENEPVVRKGYNAHRRTMNWIRMVLAPVGMLIIILGLAFCQHGPK